MATEPLLPKSYLTSPLRGAIHYAVSVHEAETRDGGAPYIVHPMGVMRKVAWCGITDEETLASAVLHDVMESKRTIRRADLEGRFGERVARTVDALTLPAEGTRIDKQKRVLYLLANGNVAEVIIKLCDRWDNLEDLQRKSRVWTLARLRRYLDETDELIRAAVDRIGLNTPGTSADASKVSEWDSESTGNARLALRYLIRARRVWM